MRIATLEDEIVRVLEESFILFELATFASWHKLVRMQEQMLIDTFSNCSKGFTTLKLSASRNRFTSCMTSGKKRKSSPIKSKNASILELERWQVSERKVLNSILRLSGILLRKRRWLHLLFGIQRDFAASFVVDGKDARKATYSSDILRYCRVKW